LVFAKVPRRIVETFALAALCALIGCASGCTSRDTLKLHYLNGIVPQTHAVFLPANIAVAPVGGELAVGSYDVGNIYNSSGGLEKHLSVSGAGAAVHDALMTGLADAGLKPIALDNPIGLKDLAGDLQPGVDAMLSCALQQLTVEKDFGAEQTIHGQYFTMTSRVGLKFTLLRRDGSTLYANEITGAEDEPPKPVGGEVFFPLETGPAESVSVAMSRAIGTLLADPAFRASFPLRTP
jgi:hypothetical protein